MYIILAIVAFGILVITHELGHFAAAKLCGVKVLEFSVGMGPQLLKKQGKETMYSLRLLPLGGYCAMEGEDESSDDPRSISAQSPLKRIIIFVAGAACNFVLGFLLVVLVYSQAGGFSSSVIDGFMPGCPYEGEEAFLPGDEIVKIDGHRIYFAANVSEYMENSGSYDIVLLRNGRRVRLDDFSVSKREYRLEDGSTAEKFGLLFSAQSVTPLSVVKYSWYTCMDFVRVVWKSLGALVTGQVGLREMSGPVGIVDTVNQVAAGQDNVRDALLDVGYLFALIAVNLAVMNMLPIPALDGGRVFCLVLTWIAEKITGRHLDPKYEGYFHTAGFVLLMGLMIFIMVSDVAKIIIR